jgi:septal ring factor EnvC (AmiA/AmiB activator)
MHQELVNKVDAYLSYVAEQWMEQNVVAIEAGLRTEVTEDFIAGLKVLFQENYIEVPEEKYDVLGEMQAKIEELTSQVNESISEAVELKKALTESKRDAVFVKVTADLAQTESEKLRGLIEEVEFDSEELFEQKLTVIKNNYFPKNVVETAAISDEQPIVEETSGTVAQYAARIARTKF